MGMTAREEAKGEPRVGLPRRVTLAAGKPPLRGEPSRGKAPPKKGEKKVSPRQGGSRREFLRKKAGRRRRKRGRRFSISLECQHLPAARVNALSGERRALCVRRAQTPRGRGVPRSSKLRPLLYSTSSTGRVRDWFGRGE